MKQHQDLAYKISRAHRIVILTGAGMSTESGIPDFRSQKGLWTQDYSLMEVVSHSFFKKDPVAFWRAFKQIFQIESVHQYEPNEGHTFFADLEKAGKDVTVITQNIDGLHTEAGNKQVLEIHGTLKRHFCPRCTHEYGLNDVLADEIPKCTQCSTILKPGVVLYGEMVHHLDEAIHAVTQADLFIALGTSLEVTPVNFIPLEAVQANVDTALINKEPTTFDNEFDIVIHNEIGKTVRRLKNFAAASQVESVRDVCPQGNRWIGKPLFDRDHETFDK